MVFGEGMDKGRGKDFYSLQKELKGPKPGPKAQLKMATYPRPGHKLYWEVEDSSVKAGVLVLLYPHQGDVYVVLTKRAERMYHHQAQISFPGGRQENEESLKRTALRETKEELNVPPETLEIMGELTPLYIPPSNYCIYPVVAVCKERPVIYPCPQEVAEVIEVPIHHLLDQRNVKREAWFIGRREMEVPFYLYKKNKIWGATAMVLAELLEIWKNLEEKRK